MNELARMEAWYVFQHLQITPRTGLNSLQLSQIGARKCQVYNYQQESSRMEDDL